MGLLRTLVFQRSWICRYVVALESSFSNFIVSHERRLMDSQGLSTCIIFEGLIVPVGFRCDDEQFSIFYRRCLEATDANCCKCDPASGHIFCERLVGLIPILVLLHFYTRPFLLNSQSGIRSSVIRSPRRARTCSNS